MYSIKKWTLISQEIPIFLRVPQNRHTLSLKKKGTGMSMADRLEVFMEEERKCLGPIVRCMNDTRIFFCLPKVPSIYT